MAIASRSPNSRFVAGVYGKNPSRLGSRMSSQRQYALGSSARRPASSASALTALNASPGGSMSPFWDPATVTSTFHSSCR